MTVTKIQLDNAAKNLIQSEGNDLTKHIVRIAIMLNPFTKDLGHRNR